MPGTDLRFDLIVATVDRVTELERLLASLERQTHRSFSVIVADQNPDDRLARVLEAHAALSLTRVTSARGLNRARNVGLGAATGDVVAFPDDDCVYPPDLLERVAARFASDPGLDALTGITAEPGGATSARWPTAPRVLDLDTVWHGGNSASLFARRDLVERLGRFDVELGFGSGNPWELGDEIDLLVRAIRSDARVEQDPTIVVHHREWRFTGEELRVASRRGGAAVGYILGKNALPARITARMLVRALGGAVVSAARGDLDTARAHAITFRWRLRGYVAGRRARRSSTSVKSSS